METMGDEEYETSTWPFLRKAVAKLLLPANVQRNTKRDPEPAAKSPGGRQNLVSFEEVFGAVYRCVCRHQSKRLYGDVLGHVRDLAQARQAELAVLGRAASSSPAGKVTTTITTGAPPSEAQVQFVEALFNSNVQFGTGVASICSSFTYLKDHYLEDLDVNLGAELMKIYAEFVTDLYAEPAIRKQWLAQIDKGILELAQSHPFAISPAVAQGLVQSLHRINRRYSLLNPSLFAKHLPGILPPMLPEELEAQKRADMELQGRLGGNDPDFRQNDLASPSATCPVTGGSRRSCKRPLEHDDEPL